MPRRDVAIYLPRAYGIYDATIQRAAGAERQTVLLARSLAARGKRVAHVVFPIAEPLPRPPGLDLVERPRVRKARAALVLEPLNIWRGLKQADADVYVLRTASGIIAVAAAFCRARGRKLVFAGANNSDFTLENIAGTRAAMYRLGVRQTDAVVVQSAEQAALAREAFPGLRQVVEIPSFVEPAEETRAPAEAFVWAARIVGYKGPMEYVELARRVPEATFRMVAVRTHGDTVPEFEQELRRRAAEVPNLELLDPLPHSGLIDLIERSVAVVNTATTEGMPNVFLEGWARGVPALTLRFDPDGRIAAQGLGISAGGDMDAMAAAARRLWEQRADRGGYGPVVRDYIERTHSQQAVGGRWADLLTGLAGR